MNGTIRKKIQIITVLDVSMVDLWAAEAFLVTDTPKALKQAIEKQMKILSMIKILFASKSSNALEVFSTEP